MVAVQKNKTAMSSSWISGNLQIVPPIVVGTGFFVDSVNGASTNNGTAWDDAMATMDQAIGKCTANAGDVIYVAPFHQEVEATSSTDLFTLDVAGVAIQGMSNGAYNALVATGAATLHNMPLFILDHASATITVSAPNCSIRGCMFMSDVADVAIGLTVSATADGFIFEDNVVRDNGAALEFLIMISVATTCPYVQIKNNTFLTTAAAGSANAIKSTANTGLVISGNKIFGKFSTGAVLTTGVLVQALITDNIIINAEAAIAIALSGTTSTGVLARNFLTGTTSQAAALTGDNAMFCFENYVNDTAGLSGLLNPGVDS